MIVACPDCTSPFELRDGDVAPLVQLACPSCDYKMILDFAAANDPSLVEQGMGTTAGYRSEADYRAAASGAAGAAPPPTPEPEPVVSTPTPEVEPVAEPVAPAALLASEPEPVAAPAPDEIETDIQEYDADIEEIEPDVGIDIDAEPASPNLEHIESLPPAQKPSSEVSNAAALAAAELARAEADEQILSSAATSDPARPSPRGGTLMMDGPMPGLPSPTPDLAGAVPEAVDMAGSEPINLAEALPPPPTPEERGDPKSKAAKEAEAAAAATPTKKKRRWPAAVAVLLLLIAGGASAAAFALHGTPDPRALLPDIQDAIASLTGP